MAIHLALVLGVAFSAGWPAEGLAAAIPIGREKQLLWDDYLIETLHNTGFVLNQAEKAPNNPVIRQDRPWEGNLIRVATVFYDEDQGRFRLWYTSENVKPSPGDRWERSGQIVCYATSRDGYRWTKPNVGRVDFNGSTRNNILDGRSWPGFKGGIIRDAHDPDPSRRYKGLVMSVAGPEPNSTSSPGMRFDLYYSSDGFEWEPYQPVAKVVAAFDRPCIPADCVAIRSHTPGMLPHRALSGGRRNGLGARETFTTDCYAGNPVIDWGERRGRWGPTALMGWDPIRRVYTAHMEVCRHRRCPRNRRLIGRAESPDLIRWTESVPILVPDSGDPPDTEFYSFWAIPYHGRIAGMLWTFRTTNTVMYPQFTFSRNGIHYDRRFREPLIPLGANGAFDSVLQPVVHGERIFMGIICLSAENSG